MVNSMSFALSLTFLTFWLSNYIHVRSRSCGCKSGGSRQIFLSHHALQILSRYPHIWCMPYSNLWNTESLFALYERMRLQVALQFHIEITSKVHIQHSNYEDQVIILWQQRLVWLESWIPGTRTTGKGKSEEGSIKECSHEGCYL